MKNENLNLLKNFAIEFGAGKNLLKSIHDGCGADVQKIKKVEIIEGSWTINKIVNTLKPQKDDLILFISVNNYNNFKYGFIDYYKEYCKADNRVSGISAFYSKKEFHETRKDKNNKHIFLLFKKEDIKGNYYERGNGYRKVTRELKEVNNNNRYFLNNIINGRSYKNNKIYISSADVCNINDHHIEFINFDRDLGINDLINDINDIFDKSGYFLLQKRQFLKQEAKKLRAKREHEHVCSLDFTKDLENLEASYKNTVKKYIDKLNKTDVFSEDFAKTLKNLEYFTRWDFSCFKDKKNRILNNLYPNEATVKNILNEYQIIIKKQNI